MATTSMWKTPDGKIHRGLFVFLGLCMANFALYQAGFNSLFALPMANAMGVTRGAIMGFTTFYAFGSAIASFTAGTLYANPKVPVRVSTTAAVLIAVVAYLLWAFASNLFMVYLAGFLIPFSMQGIKIVGSSVFAVNWFDSTVRGKLIGISACFQGIGGMVWPIVLQLVINSFGYQSGYFVLIGMACILVLPFCLFVFDRNPQEVGLLPLGYREGKSDEISKKEATLGMTLPQCMKTVPFWILFIVVFALGMQNGFKSNFSGLADEGLSAMMDADSVAMIAAVMVSIASAFDFIANLTIGAVNDKLGPVKTTFIALTIFLCFFVFMLLFESQVWAFYIAAACFGFNGCLLRTPIPLLIREIFGSKHFGSIWGFCNAIKPWASGVLATITAVAFDITGTYRGIMLFGFIMAALVYILVVVATRFVGKYDWAKAAEEAEA